MYVLADVLSAAQEAALEGRLSDDALFTLFGITPPKPAYGVWHYLVLLNRGAAHSVLHYSGHACCNDSCDVEYPKMEVSRVATALAPVVPHLACVVHAPADAAAPLCGLRCGELPSKKQVGRPDRCASSKEAHRLPHSAHESRCQRAHCPRLDAARPPVSTRPLVCVCVCAARLICLRALGRPLINSSLNQAAHPGTVSVVVPLARLSDQAVTEMPAFTAGTAADVK